MVKLNKIYTRTGDDGTTGLVDGSRLPKHAARMEAIGAVDEANSALGLAAVAHAGAEAAVESHRQVEIHASLEGGNASTGARARVRDPRGDVCDPRSAERAHVLRPCPDLCDHVLRQLHRRPCLLARRR